MSHEQGFSRGVHDIKQAVSKSMLELDMKFILQLYPEFSTIGNIARSKNPPHALLYNGFRHEQPDPCSLLWTLGGKVGVEDLAHDLLGYATGIIGNYYDSP